MTLGRLLVAGFSLSSVLLGPVGAAPAFLQAGDTLVMSNANIRLEYHLTAGTIDFYWKNSKKISAFYSGIGLSTGYVKGIAYTSWSYALVGTNQAVVTSTGSGLPAMKQYFTLDEADSFLIRVEAVGSNLKANWMGPVVVDATGGVDLGVANDNRALCVPFDNDGFVRYNAAPINSSGVGYEVAAFYDNTTRNGLVVGSVTHDIWKSGVYFNGGNNKLNQMNVFGGATSPWDVMPHGSVSGNSISSPTVFVGFGDDWRTTILNYAAENTRSAPRLAWTNGVPFGWNSWGVIQENINYADAAAVSDFFHTNLQANGFSNQGTVYINLDSYWDNLNGFELQSFVNHCHANSQKAGIYFGPFVFFGSATDATNWFVEGTTNGYRYSDVLLTDGNGHFQSTDGGLAMDPTHPGTKERIDYYVNLFTNYGFEYVKLDFLSHGALEGVHYDTNATTGIEAYNHGMQYVLNRINGRMFVSESIAPLFPYQYGHSRRIACDAEASLIGNTEYAMNSVSYGWWLDNLYQFNDPDIMVFGNGADANEQQSRLISGAVTGILLDGDDLTSASGQQGAQTCLTNAAINSVARAGQTFTPVEGNTGSSAAVVFVRPDSSTWCIAVFNYASAATNETIDLVRAGLPPGSYTAVNLWDGSTSSVTNSFAVSLNAKQSKLFRLLPPTQNSLQWSAKDNNGIWDTDGSENWVNVSNGQETVFNAGDQVLFDDTVGVPANVSVSGAVMPGSITVDSSVNNFSIQGAGSISGQGSLNKNGGSTLSLNVTGGFTGTATVAGGTLQTAGGNSLGSVSSITVSNGATLDFAGSYMTGSKPVSVSGTGVGGKGVLFNSGGSIYGNVLNVRLAGDATFGGSGRWDLGSGSQINGAYNLTIDWSAGGGYGEWNAVSVGANVAGITLTGGNFGVNNMTAGFQNPGTVFTVDTNCELMFWSGGWNGSFHVRSNGRVDLWTAPAPFNGGSIILDEGALWYSWGGSSSDEPVNSAVTLNGVARFLVGDHNIIYTNPISGPGGFVADAWNHQLVFSAANTYAGPTIIGDGPQVALSGNGSISYSSLLFFGGSNPASVHVDVSARADKTLTLAAGQTLGGIGAVAGNLVVSAGATLAPAGTNTTIGITTGANPVGSITVNSNITLHGTTVLKLNGNGTNDMVQAAGGISYGGTLNLINISGAPLAAGDSFQTFGAVSYSRAFTNVMPAIPGPGLVWDLSQLNAGKVGVMAGISRPVIGSTTVVEGMLVLSGSGGPANGSYYVLSTTNLAKPLSTWTVLATNNFDGSGVFHFTNMIDPIVCQHFYLLKLKQTGIHLTL
jgi:hypothetical protein